MKEAIRRFSSLPSLNEQQTRLLNHLKVTQIQYEKFLEGDVHSALNYNIKAFDILHPVEDAPYVYACIGERVNLLIQAGDFPEAIFSAYAAYGIAMGLRDPTAFELIIPQLGNLLEKRDKTIILDPPIDMNENFLNERMSAETRKTYGYLFLAQIMIETNHFDPFLDSYVSMAMSGFQEQGYKEGLADVFLLRGYKIAQMPDPYETRTQAIGHIKHSIRSYKDLGLVRKQQFAEEMLDSVERNIPFPYSLRYAEIMLSK